MHLFRKPNPQSRTAAKGPSKPGRGRTPQAWYTVPLRWLRYLVLAFLAVSILGTLAFRFLPVPFTPLMLLRCLGDFRSGACLDKSWRPMEAISPRLAEAVVASEDQRFFEHHGFDWLAIGSALNANGHRKRKMGASTITQQTAKNLFLWPDRTWLRKGLEAYFTVLLETLWSKRRILEVYLNIIETGDGTYGAEAAAKRYFRVSAANLNGPQAALLASVLPNPRKWSPARPTPYLLRRQAWILRQMGYLGPMPDGLSKGGPRLPAPSRVERPTATGSMEDTLAPSAPPLPSLDGNLPAPDPWDYDPEPLPEDPSGEDTLPPDPAISPDSAAPTPQNR